jgi:SAM-dependent methyltransferase
MPTQTNVIMPALPPYESPALRKATGGTLRPGGLALTERAARCCSLAAGDRVLDVGCGAGTTSAFLRDRFQVTAIGVDRSAILLADARGARPDLGLVRGEASTLPFPAGRFAALFCECVLSLVNDPPRALEEFHRVLRPGGYCVIADLYRRSNGPERPAPLAAARGCLKGAVPRDLLEQRVQAAGFDIRLWEDHSHHLKILAARLAWAGIAVRDLWGLECRPGAAPDKPPGYGLLVSRKRSTPHG